MTRSTPGGAGDPAPGEITALLARWQRGERAAFDELTPIVYGELKKLARSHLRRQGAGRTLQPTALVHELIVRLLGRPAAKLEDRHHFFAFAAKVLRQVMVDQARERHAIKRGGGAITVDVAAVDLATAPPPIDLLDLHQALEKLARRDSQLEQLVELRFFGGLTIEESASVLGRSEASISRDWAAARAFLFRELQGRTGVGAAEPG
jgi:RNA polymerase sigma factor (TIGR02999 family)